MSNGRVYLDSYTLLCFSSDKPARRQEGHIKRKIQFYEVVVPQAVIGEIVSVIIRDKEPDMIEILSSLKKTIHELLSIVDPKICMPAFNFEVIGYIKHLQSVCNLDPTDALILAHAINDSDARYFVTTDRKILRNNEILKYEKKLRDQYKRNTELEITDSL